MVLNFAHRGSLEEAPENTISAMKKALEHETAAIELDVQLTKDGHLVLIHDQKFTRFNKKYTGFVKDYTLAEIEQIDIGSSFSEDYAGETLTTLDKVLELVPKDVLLNIEIKNIPIIYDGIEDKVIDMLKAYDRLDNIIISSFDHEALKKVQAHDLGIPLGLLLYYRILEPWKYAKSTGLELTSVNPLFTTIDKQFVDEFHNLGLKVYPFTVNNEAHYAKLLEIGVDGVFSNNPKIFTTLTD